MPWIFLWRSSPIAPTSATSACASIAGERASRSCSRSRTTAARRGLLTRRLAVDVLPGYRERFSALWDRRPGLVGADRSAHPSRRTPHERARHHQRQGRHRQDERGGRIRSPGRGQCPGGLRRGRGRPAPCGLGHARRVTRVLCPQAWRPSIRTGAPSAGSAWSTATSAPSTSTHRRIDPFACEGCGLCARLCPADAVRFEPVVNGEWSASRDAVGSARPRAPRCGRGQLGQAREPGAPRGAPRGRASRPSDRPHRRRTGHRLSGHRVAHRRHPGPGGDRTDRLGPPRLWPAYWNW